VGDEVPVESQNLGSVFGLPENRSGDHGRADEVQREPERSDHPEVAAAAAQRPEQIRVFVGRRADDAALGCDDLGGQQVVDSEPVFAHEPPDPTTEREAGDAGVAHDATGGGQAVGLRLAIDVAPQRSTLHQDGAAGRVDQHGSHGREVDDDSVVAHRGAGHIVAAAPHRDLQIVGAGKAHSGNHVGGPAASGDQARAPVDGAVPDGPGGVVVAMVGGDNVAPEPVDPVFGGQCRHWSSIDTIAPPWRPSVKSRIWTSQTTAGERHWRRADLRPVLPDRAGRRDLRRALDAGDHPQPALRLRTLQ
jgi:hypothetical protein